jgi:hypothetical protein
MEMLMLFPAPKLHPAGLIKPNQTKSNQIKPAGRQKVQSSRFMVQNSMFKTPQYAEKAKQGLPLIWGKYTCAVEIWIIIMKEGIRDAGWSNPGKSG